jgi:hypothetical protein
MLNAAAQYRNCAKRVERKILQFFLARAKSSQQKEEEKYV